MAVFFVDVESTVKVIARMRVVATNQHEAEKHAIILFGQEFNGDCDSSVDTTIETTDTRLLPE